MNEIQQPHGIDSYSLFPPLLVSQIPFKVNAATVKNIINNCVAESVNIYQIHHYLMMFKIYTVIAAEKSDHPHEENW